MGKCMAVLAVAATAMAACKRQPVNATNAAGEYAAARPRPDTIQLQATLDSAFSKRSYNSLALFFITGISVLLRTTAFRRERIV